MSKTYHGYRQMATGVDGQPVECRCIVMVDSPRRHQRPLELRLDIRNHSPTGFEWGYSGSGPAQLALALVADCCGRALAVPAIYQHVKHALISRLTKDAWQLTEEQICEYVHQAAIGLDVPAVERRRRKS